MTRRRSRSVPTSMVTVLFAVAVGVAGCGNDFDALFAPAQAPSDGGTTVDGARSPTDAASQPDAAPACGAPTECTPRQICNDTTCTNSCAGCACACPPFECDHGDLDTCLTTCDAGSTCSVTCSADRACSLAAHGATAKLTCKGQTDRCTLACDQGASCDLSCSGGGGRRCIATCDASSSCLVDCGRQSGSCDVDCQGGQKRTCPQAGVFTCNRDCP